MEKKLKARFTNVAVWVYTVANAVLVAGATLTFVQGNDTFGYILIGAEVLVNVFASINNPDFKGMITDKEYIITSVEEATKAANTIYSAIEKAKDKE